MGTLIQITQFLLSLSILILLHEAGHFFAARLFKIKVEKFYLFFDPWFSLFKIKRGETEYGIGWLPLGGYVKIAGMIDESMDKEQMKQPAQPWEFRSKPAWQRLIVMIAGVTVNVILGFVIYSCVLLAWGTEYIPTKNVTHGVYCDSIATQMGLKNGDKILSVDGKYVDNFDKIPVEMLLNLAESIQVERNGQQLNIPVTRDNLALLLTNPTRFVQPLMYPVVDSVQRGTEAEKIGLKHDDRILQVDTTHIQYQQELVALFHKDSNKTVQLLVASGNTTKTLQAQIKHGKLGFVAQAPETKKTSYNILTCIPAGISRGIETVVDYAKQLKVLVVLKGAHRQIGGFITLTKAFHKVWDWSSFWGFTGFLSIMLAFLNILPIPALDGGHVIFVLYEMVTRRKPNEKFMEYAQYAGLLILATLILYANGLDIGRLFHK